MGGLPATGMVARVRVPVTQQQIIHTGPGQHPRALAVLALVELEHRSAGVIDQRVMPGDEHAQLEAERLGLDQDVQQQLVVVQRLVGRGRTAAARG